MGPSSTRTGRTVRRLRRRRRTLLAIVLLVVAGVVAYVLVPTDDLRVGSELIEEGPVNVARLTPTAYRIVYRVEGRAGGELTVSTDRLTVQRPFSSRLEALGGEPPGSEEFGVTVNAFVRLKVRDTVLAVPPAPAAADRRPDAFLDEALREGYAEERERRRVAGRVCRVYRIAGDSGASSVATVHEDLEDFTEVCIDEAGLVLEDVTFFGGRLLTRRVAVEVEVDADVDDQIFEVGVPTLDAREGGGSALGITPDSRPPDQTFWELPAPPEGFEHQGRFAVVPPQVGFDDPLQRGSIIAGVVDVWVRGPDVLVVDQGGTREGRRPFDDDPRAARVELGALGAGEVMYSLRSPEVRAMLDGGRYVRAYGTLPPSQLVEVARLLEPSEGGTLTYLDDPDEAS